MGFIALENWQILGRTKVSLKSYLLLRFCLYNTLEWNFRPPTPYVAAPPPLQRPNGLDGEATSAVGRSDTSSHEMPSKGSGWCSQIIVSALAGLSSLFTARCGHTPLRSPGTHRHNCYLQVGYQASCTQNNCDSLYNTMYYSPPRMGHKKMGRF